VPLLEIRGIRKRFGGNLVLDGVDLQVDEGEIRSLIGPNGAGKTTLFNLISGTFPADAGEILFEGKRIDTLPQYRICRAGIARTFQNARPFLAMTVVQNVMSGRLFASDSRSHLRSAEAEAMEVLEFVELQTKAHLLAESLTIGDIRRLEIARAIACRPKLVLFDEVLAGLTAQETDTALRLVKKLRQDHGITVLLVEHNMRAVMAVSGQVSVLHMGRIICSGTPHMVANDPRVVESYMGQEQHARH
jgi:branched-chain amino acid transport system ATP-binding protein